MSERKVVATGKDKDGDVTKLCNSTESWSPRSKASAIDDIDNKGISYIAVWPDGKRTPIHTAQGQNGRYLRTNRDGTTKNNLAEMPDC